MCGLLAWETPTVNDADDPRLYGAWMDAAREHNVTAREQKIAAENARAQYEQYIADILHPPKPPTEFDDDIAEMQEAEKTA
jgi:hypothetical protein